MPRGVGTQNRAGRTKAKSSSTSSAAKPGDVEPPRDGARMADDRRLAAVPRVEPGARLLRRQRLDLAVGRQPQDLAKAGDQRRGAAPHAAGAPGGHVRSAVVASRH